MSDPLDVEAIRTLLPHRFPMLLVDRILELEPGVRAVGLKNVTVNEPFFNGHFPGLAVMPGVLILEAMAQVAGVILLSVPKYHGRTPFLGSIDKARFRIPVVPGDSLITEAFVEGIRGHIGKVRMVATVNGEIVANAEMMFALKESHPRKAYAKQGKKQGDDDSD